MQQSINVPMYQCVNDEIGYRKRSYEPIAIGHGLQAVKGKRLELKTGHWIEM